MSDTPAAAQLYPVILDGLPADLRDRHPVAGNIATGLAMHLEFHPNETDVGRLRVVLLGMLPYSVDDATDLARHLAQLVTDYLLAR